MSDANVRQGKLKGQVALVTGGNTGIGAAVVRALGAEGARVCINYIANPEQAEQLAEEVRKAGGEALCVEADVSDEAAVQGMIGKVVQQWGRLDVLVNNAGIQRDAPLTEMTLEQWNAVINTNLTGQFLCSREAAKRFLNQEPLENVRARGRIICMSSVHEQIPWAGHANYASAKGGIKMLMKTMAQELAPQGIRVCAVAPGAIKTPINENVWSDPEARDDLMKLIPYGRLGEPEDIGQVVAWLASDEADYLTGVSVAVDGGMILYPGFRTGG